MVSVIIINYNTFELTCQCIQSVIHYTKSIDYEIILVDNASTECNADNFLEKFPQIKLVKSAINSGFAKGNNLGLKYATGDYVLLLNSDAFLQNDAIGITISDMQQQQVLVAACKVLNMDGTLQRNCSHFDAVWIRILILLGIYQIIMLFNLKVKRLEYDYTTAHKVDWVWGCFIIFKAAVIKQFPHQKLPDDFFMYCEDLQWGLMLKKMNIDIWFFPNGTIKHLARGGSFDINPSKNPVFTNTVIIYKNFFPKWKYRSIFLLNLLIYITRFKFTYAKNAYTIYRSQNRKIVSHTNLLL